MSVEFGLLRLLNSELTQAKDLMCRSREAVEANIDNTVFPWLKNVLELSEMQFHAQRVIFEWNSGILCFQFLMVNCYGLIWILEESRRQLVFYGLLLQWQVSINQEISMRQVALRYKLSLFQLELIESNCILA